jgi:phage uncharacterized protein TIGR01671
MREIKFRAWDRMRRKIVNVVVLSFEKDVLGFDDGDAIEYGNMKDFVLMQYTGLNDVNGNPIYKGDVVKDNNRDFETLGVIGFEFGSFRINGGDFKYMATLEEYCDGLTVIGNKFKNPELLEGTE